MRRKGHMVFWCALLCGAAANAQSSNVVANTNASAPRVEAAPQKLDESAFRIIEEKNIFNANRSGGQVRVANSRRPTRIDSFALVGTIAYEKGAFAFFEGSSSEFSKVLKPNGVIAGYKVVDILANGVMLELGGKEIELPIGSQMRREDEGTWRVSEASGHSSSSESSSYASSRENDSSQRYSRSSRGDSGRNYSSRNRGRDENGSSSRNERNDRNETTSRPTTTNSGANEDEVLKRLMERREKE